MVVSTMFVASAPRAHACGPGQQYYPAPELLAGDFNDPGSALNDDYRTWAQHTGIGDGESIEIVGAYVYESVHWGEWPDSREPRVIAGIERNAECLFPQDVALGHRSYTLITSEGALNFGSDDQVMTVLSAAFGSPETAPRDADLEAQLVSQLQAVDTGSKLPLVLGGVGLIALLGAGAFWQSTRRPAAVGSER